MAEAALAAWGIVEVVHGLPLGTTDGGNDHLSDPVTAMDHKRFVAVVDKNDSDFPTVIRVYCPRSVHHADPMVNSETTAWPYLGFKALRQGDAYPRRH